MGGWYGEGAMVAVTLRLARWMLGINPWLPVTEEGGGQHVPSASAVGHGEWEAGGEGPGSGDEGVAADGARVEAGDRGPPTTARSCPGLAPVLDPSPSPLLPEPLRRRAEPAPMVSAQAPVMSRMCPAAHRVHVRASARSS